MHGPVAEFTHLNISLCIVDHLQVHVFEMGPSLSEAPLAGFGVSMEAEPTNRRTIYVNGPLASPVAFTETW